MVDLELLGLVEAQIDATPERYDQTAWRVPGVPSPDGGSCGTAFCVAGWTAELGGGKWVSDHWGKAGWNQIQTPDGPVFIEDWARERLGITQREAEILFDGSNTREDVADAMARIRENAREASRMTV